MMTTVTQKTGDGEEVAPRPSALRRQAPLWAIVAGTCVLLGFMGWLSSQSSGPPPIKKMAPQERANRQHIYEIVQRSGGDFKKVSKEDKKWLLDLTKRADFAEYAYEEVKANPRPSWW
jgi:hypothetical protein